MKVIWAASAEQDRADIIEFISLDNPIAAIHMDELFAEEWGGVGVFEQSINRGVKVSHAGGSYVRLTCVTRREVDSRDDRFGSEIMVGVPHAHGLRVIFRS